MFDFEVNQLGRWIHHAGRDRCRAICLANPKCQTYQQRMGPMNSCGIFETVAVGGDGTTSFNCFPRPTGAEEVEAIEETEEVQEEAPVSEEHLEEETEQTKEDSVLI